MNTFRLDIGRLICGLYEELTRESADYLPRRMPDHVLHSTAMLFSVHARVQHNGTEVKRYLHLLLTGTSYVSVFAVETDVWDPHDVPVEQWTNPASHDSEWRSDGVSKAVTQLYFNLCDAVQQGVPEAQRVAPITLNAEAELGWMRPFENVLLRFTTEDAVTYRRKVLAIERL